MAILEFCQGAGVNGPFPAQTQQKASRTEKSRDKLFWLINVLLAWSSRTPTAYSPKAQIPVLPDLYWDNCFTDSYLNYLTNLPAILIKIFLPDIIFDFKCIKDIKQGLQKY